MVTYLKKKKQPKPFVGAQTSPEEAWGTISSVHVRYRL